MGKKSYGRQVRNEVTSLIERCGENHLFWMLARSSRETDEKKGEQEWWGASRGLDGAWLKEVRRSVHIDHALHQNVNVLWSFYVSLSVPWIQFYQPYLTKYLCQKNTTFINNYEKLLSNKKILLHCWLFVIAYWWLCSWSRLNAEKKNVQLHLINI